MNILHVTPTFWPSIGGIESFIRDLCLATVQSHDDRVHVLHCSRHSAGETTLRQNVDGIPVTLVRTRGWKNLFLLPNLAEFIRSFDVIHLHDPRMTGLTWHFALNARDVSLVLTTHGGFFHTRRAMLAKQAYFHLVLPFLLRAAHGMAASSVADWTRFSRVYPNIKLIEGGVDCRKFRRDSPAAGRRNRYLYFGRLSSNKRLDNLLRTFAALKRRGERFTLKIAGEDFDGLMPELLQLRQDLNLQGEVVFAGALAQTALEKAVAESDYFVTASEFEGFGLSVVEMMAAGKIVIANNINPLNKIIDDGENGFVTDFTSSEIGAEKLSAISAMDEERVAAIRTNAIARADRFDLRHVANRYRQLYAEAINRYGVERAGRMPTIDARLQPGRVSLHELTGGSLQRHEHNFGGE